MNNIMENENITPALEDENLLDGIVIDEGTELDESNVQIINCNDNQKNQNQLAYDDDCPMPGKKTEMLTTEVTENEAEKKLIEMTAMMKLQKEKEAFNRMSDDQKIKDYVMQSQYYKYTNDWFHKYGYEMTGKQKRNLKRDLERMWAKGKFRFTDEQKQEILVELSKAAAEHPNQNAGNAVNTDETAANHISDLNSLIFK